jgi:glycolate oxidase iron-sulfur subunit
MEGLFASANRATERVLERNGYRLVEAANQVCCGALHAHSGYLDTARELAKKNIDAFTATGCETVVVNSAGCGSAMKEYGELLRDDPKYAGKARDFSLRVRDVSELLADGGIETPENLVDCSVTYDAPCHLIHAQRITQAPIDLLKRIPGLVLVPLAGYESCCGGAGIYNLQHNELSSTILEEKIRSIRQTGARFVVTPNPGCIMQIGAGAKLSGLDVQVVHPIELLDAAYHASPRGVDQSI